MTAMINNDISDLFFNLDLSHCATVVGDFDKDALHEEAEWFLRSLERLGVDVPSAGDLVADFLGTV